jgi:acetyl-CoA/propionyl-CoA carboxylase biotin carboxyl carrier protein
VSGHDPVAVRVRGLAHDAEVRIDDAEPVSARLTADGGSAGGRVLVEWDGRTHAFAHTPVCAGHWLGRDGDSWHIRHHDPVAAALLDAGRASGVDALTAPMPGTVTVVKAAVGDEVAAGQSLLVVEAMKMEHIIAAPHAGRVTGLDVTPGSTVARDQVLAVVTPHGSGAAGPDAQAQPGTQPDEAATADAEAASPAVTPPREPKQ